MKKQNLVSFTDLEKLNASQLISIKGGANSLAQGDAATEESVSHDSNNNDTFNGTETPVPNPGTVPQN